uniref:TrkA family potassium uptake protein n=1 Tax=Fervidobacterium thailandense TaxID=1008305 RepID=A0A7C4GK12_9BACT
MKIVIIGGERVPYFLAKKLIAEGYNVYFVNKDEALCNEYSRTLNAVIVNGDGSSKKTLDEIEIGPDDIIVLLTERDRKNFFIARLVQEYYGVRHVVTLLNNSENEDIFTRFGIRTLKVTDLIMSNIEPLLFENQVVSELESETSNRGATVVRVSIDWGSKYARLPISRLELPEDVLIAGIVRKDQYIIPKGDTVLEPGDDLIVICKIGREMEVLSHFSE